MADALSYGILAGSTSISLPFTLVKSADNTIDTGLIASDLTASLASTEQPWSRY